MPERITNEASIQYSMEDEIILSASYAWWTCAIMNNDD
jgi:hypothetical protein